MAKIGDLFIKLGLQKGEFDKGIDDAKKKTEGFGGSFKRMSVLAAGVWAAVGTGAVMAFNAIKNSSDTLSTRWETMIGGMNAATNEFFRTLAVGDWSNFMTNLKDAIKVGREYVQMLDEIEEMQRAATMAEAKLLKENTQLEIDASDRTKTIEQRKQAAEQRIKNEEELGRKRIEIAKKIYEEERKVTAQQTRLSEKQIEQVASDFQSIGKERAKEINDFYKELSKNVGYLVPNREQIIENKLLSGFSFPSGVPGFRDFIEPFTKAEVDYAKAIRQMGDTTDEQLNKMVDAYMRLAQAEESVLGNTRRIRVRLAGLISGEENAETKSETKLASSLAKDVDNQITKSQDDINKSFQEAGKTAFDNFILAIEESQAKKTIDFSGIKLSPDEEIDDTSLYDAAKSKLDEAQRFTDELNSIIQSGITSAIETLTTGLTELAAGEITGKEFGSQILSVIGGFMKTLGGLMIAYAVNMALFAESAKNPLSWPVALGAGIALVAAGAAISGFASKGLSGGAASVAPASGYSSGYMNQSNAASVIAGNVVFELDGYKLKGALNNVDRRNTLIR